MFRESNRPAADHAATFALVLFRELGLAGAITAQIGHVHANLLAGHVDNRRDHRWQAGSEPVRGLLLEPQYRRDQPDSAAAQIDGDPLVPGAAIVDFSRLLDTSAAPSVIAITSYPVARRRVETHALAIEQPVFDERQRDLVEFAATKTEGQQLTVFAVTQR